MKSSMITIAILLKIHVSLVNWNTDIFTKLFEEKRPEYLTDNSDEFSDTDVVTQGMLNSTSFVELQKEFQTYKIFLDEFIDGLVADNNIKEYRDNENNEYSMGDMVKNDCKSGDEELKTYLQQHCVRKKAVVDSIQKIIDLLKIMIENSLKKFDSSLTFDNLINSTNKLLELENQVKTANIDKSKITLHSVFSYTKFSGSDASYFNFFISTGSILFYFIGRTTYYLFDREEINKDLFKGENQDYLKNGILQTLTWNKKTFVSMYDYLNELKKKIFLHIPSFYSIE